MVVAHTSDTTNRDRKGITYGNNGLSLQLNVSHLSIRTRLARNRENNHALVSIHATRHVPDVNRKQIDRNQTRVLTAAAVIAVRHGAIHVSIGDDLTGLRVHLDGVPVRLLVLELLGVVVVSGGRPVATKTCDRGEIVMAQKTATVSGVGAHGGRR